MLIKMGQKGLEFLGKAVVMTEDNDAAKKGAVGRVICIDTTKEKDILGVEFVSCDLSDGHNLCDLLPEDATNGQFVRPEKVELV